MLYEKRLKISLVVFSIFFMSGCVSSKVGGAVSYTDNAGRVTEHYESDCWGSCKQISSDGKCIKFQQDISRVCASYLAGAKLLKPVQGDHSVFINGVTANKDFNINTDKKVDVNGGVNPNSN